MPMQRTLVDVVEILPCAYLVGLVTLEPPPNGEAERRGCRRMGLALYGPRVRSSAVLERTCRSSTKLIEAPCH